MENKLPEGLRPDIRAAVTPIGGQPADEQVNPPIDDVSQRQSAGQESAQQLLDGSPSAVDNCGGQLLLALRKVVIQRARLDARFVEDLVEPGRGVALTAEQGGRGVDQRGPAAVGSWHGIDNT